MVGGGSDPVRAEQTHELSEQVRLKLCTTISGNGGWCSEASDPAGHEGLGYSGCGDVG